MIAANLPVSKDCCNNVLKPVNTFGQKKLDLNLWRESLASHPSLDILIFVLGRSKPGQKCVFFRRQRRKTKIRLLHFGILRQRAVDPGQRKPGRQPPAPLGLGKVVSVHPRPAWLGSPLHIQSSNTHYTYLWCANHPGFLMQKGPSDILIKLADQDEQVLPVKILTLTEMGLRKGHRERLASVIFVRTRLPQGKTQIRPINGWTIAAPEMCHHNLWFTSHHFFSLHWLF